MPTLPAHPHLDQLRRQAKELLRAATAGDGPALERIHTVSEHLKLAGAQLALAREYGFESWPALGREVDTRTRSRTETIDAFLAASVGYRVGQAARMSRSHRRSPITASPQHWSSAMSAECARRSNATRGS
jgi:hypothetical protein